LLVLGSENGERAFALSQRERAASGYTPGTLVTDLSGDMGNTSDRF